MGGQSFLGIGYQQLTVVTGYLALVFLALTLLIGPANLLLGKRNPTSSYLRRDVGIWTAGFSILHVFFGLQLHGRLTFTGDRGILSYFIAPDGSLYTNSFGWANWTGLLDMHSSGAFPQSRVQGGSMDMDMDMNHNEDQADCGDDSEHGGGRTGSVGDGEGQSTEDHGRDEATPMDAGEHGEDQSEPTDGGDHGGDESERAEGDH